MLGAVPAEWRTATVSRVELDRFLFEPGDVVLALGQDGLVANVSKYLDGQPVVGLNPDPERVMGVLVRHPPQAAGDLIADLAGGRARIQERTMAEARLDDGQVVTALNEIFVGHESHQSARYTLALGGHAERQSSSGVIASTGTGATGWAASINRQYGLALPGPADRELAFFVREAWPSRATSTSLTSGTIAAGTSLSVVCELGRAASCSATASSGTAFRSTGASGSRSASHRGGSVWSNRSPDRPILASPRHRGRSPYRSAADPGGPPHEHGGRSTLTRPAAPSHPR